MIRNLKTRIKATNGFGIFHDSRNDVRVLGKEINNLIDKMDEIINVVNNLSEKIKLIEGIED